MEQWKNLHGKSHAGYPTLKKKASHETQEAFMHLKKVS
jgi:hypothetical protein